MAALYGGAPNLEIHADRLLLVEGRDEVNLFGALLQRNFEQAETSNIQVIDAGGKDTFRNKILAIRSGAESGPTIRSLGVVRDADDNANRAFQSVCDALRGAGYDPPAAHGEIRGDPTLGVFILPNGAEAGTIETLCRRSITETEIEASRCVETFINCLKRQRVLHSRNEDKTFAHAWLSSKRDPVARVGEGAQQGAWKFDSDAFADLSDFLRRLFAPAARPGR